MVWTDEEHEGLLKLKEQGLSYQQIADRLTFQFDRQFTHNSVRNRWRRANEYRPTLKEVSEVPNIKSSYNEDFKINKDGSRSSNKLIEMDEAQEKDETFLLHAHGFNDSWEIIEAVSSKWNQHNKQDGTVTLYSSRIKVKKKQSGISKKELMEVIQDLPSITYKVNKTTLHDKRLLEIPIYDPHFGISTLEEYEDTVRDIYSVLHSKRWEEVVFVIGQDLLHHDNFRNSTASGTVIEQVDIKQAWKDAYSFYLVLVELAIKQSNYVKLIYSKGNHDESMSWCFVQALKVRFPQLEVDDEIQERKAHTFHNIFLGYTHGDKARNKLHNLFPVEFPEQWARAKTREVKIGHIHTEDAKDVFGMMIRTLSTRNKTDQWHKDNGFVGNHKRFMLFEYNEDELKHIHYV